MKKCATKRNSVTNRVNTGDFCVFQPVTFRSNRNPEYVSNTPGIDKKRLLSADGRVVGCDRPVVRNSFCFRFRGKPLGVPTKPATQVVENKETERPNVPTSCAFVPTSCRFVPTSCRDVPTSCQIVPT